MEVVVQNLESKLYLAKDGSWVNLDAKPATFANAVDAVSFCIQRRLRAVRMVMDASTPGSQKFLYPFGGDPAIKAERKKLRTAFSASRRLKLQQRQLLARIEKLQSPHKRARKKAAFTCKPSAAA